MYLIRPDIRDRHVLAKFIDLLPILVNTGRQWLNNGSIDNSKSDRVNLKLYGNLFSMLCKDASHVKSHSSQP